MTILLDLAPASRTDCVGPDVAVATTAAAATQLVDSGDHDLVVVGPDVEPDVAFALADAQRRSGSHVGVVLVVPRVTTGLLRQALVNGVRDVVTDGDSQALGEACRRSREVTRQLRAGAPHGDASGVSGGKVVTVFAAKGGCGKTTVATNLATAFAKDGLRTVVLDLDLAFGDVAIALQMSPARTIADAVGLTSLDETAITSLVTTHECGLDALLAPIDPGTAEAVPVALVGELVELLRRVYDVVVIDSPPAFTDHVLASFDRTDEFVLLTTLDVASLKNLKLTLETLAMLNYPAERWHVVLNRSDAKVGLTLQDVERTLGTKVDVQLPSSRAVPASVNRGMPIVLDHPGHPVSTGLRRLAHELVPPAARRASKRRLGRRLRGTEARA